MALTKNDVKEIRNTIQNALDELNAKSDFEAKLGNASFSLSSINFKMSVAIENDDGVLVTPEADAFKRNAHAYGFKPSDLGAEIEIGWDKKGTIVGLKTRNRKYPIIAEATNGKMYKLSVDQTLRALGRPTGLDKYFSPTV